MRLTTKTTKIFYNIVIFFSCFSGQTNPPLTRNCDREDSVIYDHCRTQKRSGGKIDGKSALKPGNFGMRASVGSDNLVWG